ncbi:MAG: multidrug ABC transporter permease [Desulfosporosinus sp. BRH_c37]|nr:MAG: multidrug ABC transporter permease [Desulfosporosinus sp. BRH_c37]
MRNAWLLTLNTLKVLLRKKGNIIIFFILPIIGMLVSIGVYSNLGSTSVRIGVIDNDQSALVGDFVQSISQQETMKVTAVTEGEKERQISSGKVDCVLVIPVGFAEAIYNGNIKPVEIFSIKGEAATAWIQSYTNIYLRNLQDISEASGENKNTFEKIYNNIKQAKFSLQINKVQDQTKDKGMTTQMIGFLIMFMMLGAGNTAEMILREKRNRTYYRICSAPVSAKTYIFGNVLANLLLVMLQISLALFMMIKVFKIQTHVPVVEMFMILVLFGLVAIGLGVLIVAFSDDSKQAGTLQNLFITPTCMLAGCFWPIEIMPKSLQQIADFLPQKWTIGAIQKLQMGGSFDQIMINILIIAAFALTFFLVAAYRFGRNDSVKTFI